MTETTMSGADLIAAERRRQVEAEGCEPEHDDTHAGEELAYAAVCYATPEEDRRGYRSGRGLAPGTAWQWIPHWWPWEVQSWKPTPNDRVRELVKAGALIAAEIDRLQRIPTPTPEPAHAR
jgi:hypothetical protein